MIFCLQPVDLSDCPELQSPQPAEGENAESPFVWGSTF